MTCDLEKDCPCAKTECENHRICCKCVASHKERGNLPVCLRPAE